MRELFASGNTRPRGLRELFASFNTRSRGLRELFANANTRSRGSGRGFASGNTRSRGSGKQFFVGGGSPRALLEGLARDGFGLNLRTAELAPHPARRGRAALPPAAQAVASAPRKGHYPCLAQAASRHRAEGPWKMAGGSRGRQVLQPRRSGPPRKRREQVSAFVGITSFASIN